MVSNGSQGRGLWWLLLAVAVLKTATYSGVLPPPSIEQRKFDFGWYLHWASEKQGFCSSQIDIAWLQIAGFGGSRINRFGNLVPFCRYFRSKKKKSFQLFLFFRLFPTRKWRPLRMRLHGRCYSVEIWIFHLFLRCVLLSTFFRLKLQLWSTFLFIVLQVVLVIWISLMHRCFSFVDLRGLVEFLLFVPKGTYFLFFFPFDFCSIS